VKGNVAHREQCYGSDRLLAVVQVLSHGRVMLLRASPVITLLPTYKSDDDDDYDYGCQHTAVVVSCALLISGLHKFKLFLHYRFKNVVYTLPRVPPRF
jgi:hypothetical protein